MSLDEFFREMKKHDLSEAKPGTRIKIRGQKRNVVRNKLVMGKDKIHIPTRKDR